ncbi:MAG TPA: NAD-dependent epimerase/dehydratase family protein [Vicinamibacterales bacterium]|nr:NAD-dependent epimerase/dehydratase family protein [Vicinamibacterales bacterium]
MQIVITGGAGFLGRRLADRLLERGTLRAQDGTEREIERITLVDVVPPRGSTDARMATATGDIADSDLLTRVIGPDTTSVFHLAAIVSGMAEADFDLGMRSISMRRVSCSTSAAAPAPALAWSSRAQWPCTAAICPTSSSTPRR